MWIIALILWTIVVLAFGFISGVIMVAYLIKKNGYDFKRLMYEKKFIDEEISIIDKTGEVVFNGRIREVNR